MEVEREREGRGGGRKEEGNKEGGEWRNSTSRGRGGRCRKPSRGNPSAPLEAKGGHTIPTVYRCLALVLKLPTSCRASQGETPSQVTLYQ